MPDWVTDCIKEKSLVAVDRYHPKLIVKAPPKPPTPPPEPEPPQSPVMGGALRPQDLPIGPARTPGHSPGSTPGPDSPKTPNSRTKEVLARMVNNRLQAGRVGEDIPAVRGPSLPTSPRAQLRALGSDQKSPTARMMVVDNFVQYHRNVEPANMVNI